MESDAFIQVQGKTSTGAIVPRALPFAGALGFALSFLLPACQDAGGGGAGPVGVLRGWECARMSLALATEASTYHSPFFLAFLSGWINPLLLACLMCRVAPRLNSLRSGLAVVIFALVLLTWCFFAVASLTPLAGHYVWVCSIVLLLTPELDQVVHRTVWLNSPHRLRP